uniref:Gfo/Idh/MocA family protein n=1 Tax=Ningiella ruwaisensis TaxID=2364274 RepID=UPI00109F9AC5|nr:Gfo/Idh/MocA family oxidoreductase [Ningiella ruwaisensis]
MTIRWGIIGCGHIAKTFVSSFNAVEGATLVACAASEHQRAQAFAKEHGIAKTYEDYHALVQSNDIDVVYIATTHNFHFEHIKLCLAHNKHVLCEKPLCINAKQAREIQALAKTQQRLVVEAVWTRFLPAIQSLKEMLDNKVIGNITSVYCNFSLNRELADEHRLMNPKLAGGALLDLGIYPITFADIVFDEKPSRANASAIKSHTGVDKVSSYMLTYSDGASALLSAGFKQSAVIEAKVHGELGYIEIPHFLGANCFTVHLDGKDPKTYSYPYNDTEKFRFEIEHVNNCLKKHYSDSPILSLSKSIDLLDIMDELRTQFELVYDDDEYH